MFSSARHRSQGFSLIELLLVLGVLALLLVAMFVVYPSVRTEMRVGKEVSYITGAIAKFQSTFPNNRYAGVQNVWNTARAAKEPWAVSPNGWEESWAIVGANKPGSQPINCGSSTGSCSYLWVQLYMRGSQLNEAECLKLLSILSSRFDMPGFTNPGPSTFISQCDKTSSGPVYISFLTR